MPRPASQQLRCPAQLRCFHHTPQPGSTAARCPPPPPLLPLSPTCLLGLAPGGGAPRPIARGVEGCHADHVGRIAGQVLEFHAVLGQEKRLHPLREVTPLGFPEINLWAQPIVGVRGTRLTLLLPLPAPGSRRRLRAYRPHTLDGSLRNSTEVFKSCFRNPSRTFLFTVTTSVSARLNSGRAQTPRICLPRCLDGLAQHGHISPRPMVTRGRRQFCASEP